jgi:hypothetical protein
MHGLLRSDDAGVQVVIDRAARLEGKLATQRKRMTTTAISTTDSAPVCAG